ncbi:MAG: threonine-phosphate decarboxylase CobD [Candidatus Omnitrophota bacterium]
MPDMNFLHGGNIREVARERREGMIDFSANINPLGLARGAKEAVFRNLDRVLCYPDPRGRDVIKKVAARWKIDERNILLGNGSAELIYLIMAAYRPKTTIIVVPTFSEYERAAVSVKSSVRFLRLKEEKGFGLDLSHPAPAEITFLCNPNNPTGNLILENGRVPEILSGGLLVIDEAFMDFLPNEDEHTLIRKAVENRKMIVLRTFTKIFAVPGLRIGYLVAHRDVVSELERHQAPWNTNSLAQVAVERSMDDKEYIKRTHELIEGERKFLFAQLAKIRGLRPYPSSANFILMKIENEGMTSGKLKDALIKKGILIRDCSNFRYLGDKFVRIAVRSHEENVKLINALRSAA